jgi:hypothetical protein
VEGSVGDVSLEAAITFRCQTQKGIEAARAVNLDKGYATICIVNVNRLIVAPREAKCFKEHLICCKKCDHVCYLVNIKKLNVSDAKCMPPRL